MRPLLNVEATPEQLKIIQDYKPGAVLIRGAAGSGKTTTALLRLKFLLGFWARRRTRLGHAERTRILVLTYNRTLRGYIESLVHEQVVGAAGADVSITTFGKWSIRQTKFSRVLNDGEAERKIHELGRSIRLPEDVLADEVDYIIGRFQPGDVGKYVTSRRDGRGKSPRFDQPLRQEILDKVIVPYSNWKKNQSAADWNDLAIHLSQERAYAPYQVVIVDEAQDFCANQVRAIKNHLAEDFSLTFVLDAAQRIYPRGFNWTEVGISIPGSNSHRLSTNYRNTVEIATLAKSLLDGLELGDDGTIPDLSKLTRHGPKPEILQGRFADQASYAINKIKSEIDLSKESVAFLHPKGWLKFLKDQLRNSGLPFIEITRESEWPKGPANIAVSTIHSSKGLEFDHVMLLGLNAEVTPHGSEDGDTQLESLRRLLAMAITRARKSVTLGYKPSDQSSLFRFLDPSSYIERSV